MIPKKALTLQKGPLSYKVQIRRLPPLLNEDEFNATIQEYLSNIVHKYYVKGKLKEQDKIDSRCYLFFNNEQSMNNFIQNYKKVFCDEKGIYYSPFIGKALFQNQQDILRKTINPVEGKYEKSELYKRFIKMQEEQQAQIIQQEEPQQQQQEEQQNQEEKPKKFEKVKTHIIMQLEKEYQKEKDLKNKIDNMNNSNIIKLQCEENGKIIERTFIFVPKAKF